MSWYNEWNNWLNTTIRILQTDCNENNVGFYFFKDNAYRDKAKYRFGRTEHYLHKQWSDDVRTHRNRRTLM